VTTPRTDTRDRILDIGERMMMQVGYHGLTFHDIADELGVKTAAVHYHFRTKADLGVAVLVRYGVKFDAWQAQHASSSPAARLQAYLELGRYVVSLHRACALGLIITQLDTVPDELRVTTRLVQERILAFYAQTLDEGRAKGQITFPGDAADKAVEVSCALVGAQQLARAYGPETYERVATQIQLNLGLIAA
jgi:AcrR family transcriptional regulator